MDKLEIVYKAPADLVHYSRNPRKNDHVVDKMAASIREFGFKIPILAKSDGTVIDGHLRLKAAEKLKLDQVPVIICDSWTEAQVKAFRLVANKSVSWAEWDSELLALEMRELSEADYDLALTGFAPLEIADLLAQKKIDDPDNDNGLVPEGEDNVMVKLSFPGAVWLGKRDEIMAMMDRIAKNYLCVVRVDE